MFDNPLQNLHKIKLKHSQHGMHVGRVLNISYQEYPRSMSERWFSYALIMSAGFRLASSTCQRQKCVNKQISAISFCETQTSHFLKASKKTICLKLHNHFHPINILCHFTGVQTIRMNTEMTTGKTL